MTTQCTYLGLGLLLLVASACDESSRHHTTDASPSDDLGMVGVDGDFHIDAGVDVDAFVDPGMDAFVDPGMDASMPMDADVDSFVGIDSGWGTCTYGGVMGTCMSVSTCTGGYMPMAGLCPGPADIQCCLPTPDAGPRPDGSTGTITPADVLARLGGCTRVGGDYANDAGDAATIPICQTGTVFWWTADMDIDCDGGRGTICMSDPDYMSSTSAVDSTGAALDASTLPFIVIPLVSSRWSYTAAGIHTGQVALVIYGGHMVFGIFGDAGPSSAIGEASYAMAQALGIPSSPTSGGVDSGVTYLVFTGTGARVTHNEDHAEAVSLGNSLLSTFVGP